MDNPLICWGVQTSPDLTLNGGLYRDSYQNGFQLGGEINPNYPQFSVPCHPTSKEYALRNTRVPNSLKVNIPSLRCIRLPGYGWDTCTLLHDSFKECLGKLTIRVLLHTYVTRWESLKSNILLRTEETKFC